jgi:hypothetical protein
MIAPFVPLLHVVAAPKFSCSLSHASLECAPRCGSLDHAMDAANTIGRWPLVDDHPHMPKVRVPMMQPQDTDEVPGARSVESSKSIQHSDHHRGTP